MTARPLKPHGTRAAYLRHVKGKTVPCQPCNDANTRYQARLREGIRTGACAAGLGWPLEARRG